ncbi:UNVERIFIED_CONTAM: hypothetical protein ITH36_24490, partial [Salmonella enterica subsp. enterica serovar Weltevreden]
MSFMVSKGAIQANPDQVEALKTMNPPKTVREVQHLNGRLSALSRLLSKSAEKALPFFKTLQKSSVFQWTDACQSAFEELKAYLSQLPVLTSPVEGEPLYVYLSVCEGAVSSVLLKEEEKV